MRMHAPDELRTDARPTRCVHTPNSIANLMMIPPPVCVISDAAVKEEKLCLMLGGCPRYGDVIVNAKCADGVYV